MLAHGIAAGGLFLAVGVLQDRRGTTLMADFGGLWKQTPLFAASFLVIVLTAVGLPGLCGFVGEFLVLMGTFTAGKDWQAAGLHVPLFGQPALLASVATGAGILAAVYLLTMFQRVMFGSLDKTASREPMRDLGWRERFVFGVLVVAALFMGLMPQPIIERTSATVKALTSGYASRLAEARNNPDGPAHRITSGVRDPRAEGVQRF
jgi:NADH-quinone oxidoreductase subunit M